MSQRCGEFFDLEENLKKRQHSNPPPPERTHHALTTFWEEFNCTSAATSGESGCGFAGYQQNNNGCAETNSALPTVTAIQQGCKNETTKTSGKTIVDKCKDIPYTEPNQAQIADEILSNCCTTEIERPGVIVHVKQYRGGPAAAAYDMRTCSNSETVGKEMKEKHNPTAVQNQNPMEKLKEYDKDHTWSLKDLGDDPTPYGTSITVEDGPRTAQNHDADHQWILKDLGDDNPLQFGFGRSNTLGEIRPGKQFHGGPASAASEDCTRTGSERVGNEIKENCNATVLPRNPYPVEKLQEHEQGQIRNSKDLRDSPTPNGTSIKVEDGPRTAQNHDADHQWILKDLGDGNLLQGGFGRSNTLGGIEPVENFHGGPAAASEDCTPTGSERAGIEIKEKYNATVLPRNQHPVEKLQEHDQDHTWSLRDLGDNPTPYGTNRKLQNGPSTAQSHNADHQRICNSLRDGNPQQSLITTQREVDRSLNSQMGQFEHGQDQTRNSKDLRNGTSIKVEDGPRTAQNHDADHQWILKDLGDGNPLQFGFGRSNTIDEIGSVEQFPGGPAAAASDKGTRGYSESIGNEIKEKLNQTVLPRNQNPMDKLQEHDQELRDGIPMQNPTIQQEIERSLSSQMGQFQEHEQDHTWILKDLGDKVTPYGTPIIVQEVPRTAQSFDHQQISKDLRDGNPLQSPTRTQQEVGHSLSSQLGHFQEHDQDHTWILKDLGDFPIPYGTTRKVQVGSTVAQNHNVDHQPIANDIRDGIPLQNPTSQQEVDRSLDSQKVKLQEHDQDRTRNMTDLGDKVTPYGTTRKVQIGPPVAQNHNVDHQPIANDIRDGIPLQNPTSQQEVDRSLDWQMEKFQEHDQDRTRSMKDLGDKVTPYGTTIIVLDEPSSAQSHEVDHQWVLRDLGDVNPLQDPIIIAEDVETIDPDEFRRAINSIKVYKTKRYSKQTYK